MVKGKKKGGNSATGAELISFALVEQALHDLYGGNSLRFRMKTCQETMAKDGTGYSTHIGNLRRKRTMHNGMRFCTQNKILGSTRSGSPSQPFFAIVRT
jgi:transposase